jgi:hypothetical protein
MCVLERGCRLSVVVIAARKSRYVMLRHPFDFSNLRFRRLTISDRESLSACGQPALFRSVPRNIRIVTVACETGCNAVMPSALLFPFKD